MKRLIFLPAGLLLVMACTPAFEDTTFTGGSNLAADYSPIFTPPPQGDPIPDSGSITAYFTMPGNTNPPLKQDLISLIDGAVSTVDFALYSFTESNLITAITNAHNRGVSVRFVGEDSRTSNSGYIAMTTLGVPTRIRFGNPIQHNKVFIVDSQTVWTGSTNGTAAQMDDDMNNAIIIQSSVIAAGYKREFEQMFSGIFGPNKSDVVQLPETQVDEHRVTLGTMPVEFYFSPQDSVHDYMIREILNASTNIYFLANSFTRADIRNALIERGAPDAENKIPVFGVFDKGQAYGSSSQDEGVASACIPVEIGGTTTGSNPMQMHNKIFIFDVGGTNPTLITGSANWSSNGSYENDENIVIIRDSALVNQYYNYFLTVWNDADSAIHQTYTDSGCPAPGTP